MKWSKSGPRLESLLVKELVGEVGESPFSTAMVEELRESRESWELLREGVGDL